MERIDSDRTDESPFGSTLTTPVDEDVILFPGIEQRLDEKSHSSHHEVEEGFTMIPNEGGENVLCKSIDSDYTKSIEGTTLQIVPTPQSTLQRSSVIIDALPTSDAVKRRATRPRGQPTDLLPPAASDVDLSDALNAVKSISQGTRNTTCEVEEIPEEAAPFEEKLTSTLNIGTDQHSVETAKDFLALLPFAHQSAALDVARATDYLSSLEQLSFGSLVLDALRALFFLPWCVIAGASIILFPRYLETIVFGLGYVASPQGIHRFAFWAEVSKELFSTFLAFLLVVWCLYPAIGHLLMCLTVVRFLYAWKDFKPNRKIRVGEDDMQSLYYVSRHYIFGDDALISLREDEDGFSF
ncbi:hypothetical protein C0993_001756 [Termitomyces sp. T159_Od127]|nr:hypothetical protein C0993_001756 [Termitomyces sp. T159_Od127]